MDKIRILWIDDRHQGGLPEGRLPEKYRSYFEIVDPRPMGRRPYSSEYSFPSASHFVPYLDRFWRQKDRSLLPCEILVTDYDLSRAALGTDDGDSTSLEDKLFLAASQDIDLNLESPQKLNEYHKQEGKSHEDSVNYDGLIINTLYSCLTHSHPSSLVSITSLMKSMPSGVRTLQDIAEPFIGVNFEQNLGGLERSWEQILVTGLPHLRDRIRTLHENDEMLVSMSDLEAIIDSGGSHPTLTIQSPFSIRVLPTQGLFVDISDDEQRQLEITKWCEGLLEAVVRRTSFKVANQIVEELWAFYDADEGSIEYNQLEDRQRLSSLLRKNETGTEVEQLRVHCGVDGTNCQVCADIREFKYSDDIQRLAIVIMAFKLITHMIRTRNKLLELELSKSTGYARLIENDLWFALFPLPKNPVVLPASLPSYRENNWEKFISRLDLSILHIVDGRPSSTVKKTKGLRRVERQLLRMLAMRETDLIGKIRLEESVFFEYVSARLLLWGEDS